MPLHFFSKTYFFTGPQICPIVNQQDRIFGGQVRGALYTQPKAIPIGSPQQRPTDAFPPHLQCSATGNLGVWLCQSWSPQTKTPGFPLPRDQVPKSGAQFFGHPGIVCCFPWAFLHAVILYHSACSVITGNPGVWLCPSLSSMTKTPRFPLPTDQVPKSGDQIFWTPRHCLLLSLGLFTCSDPTISLCMGGRNFCSKPKNFLSPHF